MDNIKQLMENRHRTTYVRITALTKDELPIETIEGAITGGSISVDGASAVRRTCNLTLISQNTAISELNWAIKNKFKLEIGILNIPMNEITWFKQGIYGITSFSQSYSTTGINIAIQGKDKMGYLDGTFGGVITAQTDFATIDEIDTEGNITNKRVPIKDIIRNIVHQIGQELYHNIFISGLDQYGYELWDYRGDKQYPLFYFYKINEDGTCTPVNATLNGDLSVGDGILLKDIPEDDLYQYSALFATGKPFKYGELDYKIARFDYGETAGYHKTDLTYAGELIAAPGETIISILDKIRDMLGMFEYFYDLDGRFVFQRKTATVEGALQPPIGTIPGSLSDISNNKYSYIFEDTSLITQISSSPDIGNIKNDIVVWGNKPTATNKDGIPIHARFAIAHKPISYTPMEKYEGVYLTYLGEVTPDENEQRYCKENNNYYKVRRPYDGTVGLVESTQYSEGLTLYQKKEDGYYPISKELIFKRDSTLGFIKCVENDFNNLIGDYYILKSEAAQDDMRIEQYDWREILYQMALDYFQHGEFVYYPHRLMGQGYYDGKTGYEAFYTDMQAFWRLLYDPSTPFSYPQVIKENADYCNISKKVIVNASLADKINGYLLSYTTKENTRLYYLMPWQDGIASAHDYLYLLDQNPNKLSELIDFEEEKNLISNDNITVLKDNAPDKTLTYDDIIKYSYQYPVKFYKQTEEYYPQSDQYKYWNKTAITAPEDLIFWIDFLDTPGPVGEYSIQEIGTRSVVENADNIKSVYTRKVPEVEFVAYPQSIEPNPSANDGLILKQLRVPQQIIEMFTISSQGLSAADRIDELVYKHVCGTEGINFSCVPLYHLEPNTLIYINSEDIKVNGDYYITSFTLPLTYNGTMSISASKVIKRLK